MLRQGVTVETARELYRYMVLSRTLEDRLHAVFRQGRLRGRLVTGRGQEAIPVGVTLATSESDFICPVHRDMGAHLVRGTTPETVFLSYFGRASSHSRGRDGDVHFGDWSRGVFPMVSHLPDSWPVATGIAFASQLRNEGSVTVAFCGDGATSVGAWHETLNFAGVFQTPNVFVVENNQYAYSTPVTRQFRVRDLAQRAAAYGFPGTRVDGNDAVAVHAAGIEAVARARQGEGPTLIEAVTMRMDGHAVHDGAGYVPAGLLRSWRERDPLELLATELREAGVSETALDAEHDDARAHVEDGLRAAEAAPLPDADTLETGVFAEAQDAGGAD